MSGPARGPDGRGEPRPYRTHAPARAVRWGMNVPRLLLLAPLLALPLAACNQIATTPPPAVCTADFRFPSISLAAAQEPGGTYTVTAPTSVVVTTDGKYGSSSCPEYLASVKLVVNGAEVASASRTAGNPQGPLTLTWLVQPGQNGVPGSGGQATLEVRVRGTLPNGQPVQSNAATVRVTVP